MIGGDFHVMEWSGHCLDIVANRAKREVDETNLQFRFVSFEFILKNCSVSNLTLIGANLENL